MRHRKVDRCTKNEAPSGLTIPLLKDPERLLRTAALLSQPAELRGIGHDCFERCDLFKS
jgi:hypothetical protein